MVSIEGFSNYNREVGWWWWTLYLLLAARLSGLSGKERQAVIDDLLESLVAPAAKVDYDAL